MEKWACLKWRNLGISPEEQQGHRDHADEESQQRAQIHSLPPSRGWRWIVRAKGRKWLTSTDNVGCKTITQWHTATREIIAQVSSRGKNLGKHWLGKHRTQIGWIFARSKIVLSWLVSLRSQTKRLERLAKQKTEAYNNKVRFFCPDRPWPRSTECVAFRNEVAR